MLEKGELSFIFLWVLNPIVILFYQNCSTLPPVHAKANAAPAIEQKRQAASADERWPGCVNVTPSKTCAE